MWYKRQELPQLGKTDLEYYKHEYRIISINKLIPLQKERFEHNLQKQRAKIAAGRYNPIVVDKDYRIINGHHRYDVLKELQIPMIGVFVLEENLEAII